jgi:hypothetical protein
MIPKLTRRSAVAMATVGLVAGCSGGGGTASAGTRPVPAAEAALQARAARDSAALLARYDAVAAAYPQLAARLAPLRADTARHVRAFGGSAPAAPAGAAKGATPGSTGSPAPGGSPSSAPPPTGSAPPSPTGPAPAVPDTPDTPDKALADLATAERTLADRRTTALLDAPADLARLLASVAAAGAGHVVLLGPTAGK